MNLKNYNPQVTDFLRGKNHPENELIEKLREVILSTDDSLEEAIKWNGPNYSIKGEDRITMRLFPPKSFQLIFHCGSKPRTDLKDNLIEDDTGLLIWKSKDRAIIELYKLSNIDKTAIEIVSLIKKWIKASR